MFKRACAVFSLYLLLSGCQPSLMTGVIQLQETDQLDFHIQAENADMCLRDVTQVDLSLLSGPNISKNQLLSLKRKGYSVTEPVNGRRTISKRLQLTRSQMQSKGIIVNLIADFSQGATGQLSLYNKANQFLGTLQFEILPSKKSNIKTRIRLQSNQKNSCSDLRPVLSNATVTQAAGPLLTTIATPSPSSSPSGSPSGSLSTAWVKANNHATLTNYVFGLAIGPDSQLMYAATVHGVRKSTDGGLNWYGTGYTSQASNVAIAESDPNVVYASAGDVWKSTDGGQNWVQILPQAGGDAYIGIAVSPTDANLVLTGTKRSTNGGTSWTSNGLTGNVRQIQFIDANTVYASNYENGLYKSTNGGQTWSLIATQGLNGFGGQYGVDRFDVNKNNPNHIVAAPYGLVYHTFDGGAHWTVSKMNNYDFSGRYVAIDPSNPNIVYSADYSLSMERSTDGGVTFETFHTGLTSCNVYTVAVNSNGRAFVGNSDACNTQGNYGEVYYTN